MVSIVTSGCALWPYKKDFDCPIPEGLKCTPLHEVAAMADRGDFESEKLDRLKSQKSKNSKNRKNIRNKNRCNCHAS